LRNVSACFKDREAETEIFTGEAASLVLLPKKMVLSGVFLFFKVPFLVFGRKGHVAPRFINVLRHAPLCVMP
jgi:hypothetical protein